MPTDIKCPNCATVFDVEAVLSTDARQKLEQEFQQKLQASLTQLNGEKRKLEEDQRLFEEKRKKENELFQQKLQQEKIKLEESLQLQIRKSVSEDFENQLRILKESEREKDEKLKSAQLKELDFMRKQKDLETRENELE